MLNGHSILILSLHIQLTYFITSWSTTGYCHATPQNWVEGVHQQRAESDGIISINLHKRRSTQINAAHHIRRSLAPSRRIESLVSITDNETSDSSVSVPLSVLSDVRCSYLGYIELGTPPVKYSVLFDSGSALLWVPSSRCHSEACKARRCYNATASSSNNGQLDEDSSEGGSVGKNFHLRYKDGDSVRGVLFRENLLLNGRTLVEGIHMGEALTMSGFQGGQTDGILGLGFAERGEPKTILDTMLEQGLIKRRLFAIYLDHSEAGLDLPLNEVGMLTLGGFNKAHFRGDIFWLHLARKNYFELRLEKIRLEKSDGPGEEQLRPSGTRNSTKINIDGNIPELGCSNGCRAIVDTGANFICGHPRDVKLINERLGARLLRDGFYALRNCNLKKMPNLVLTLNDIEFVLKPEQYLILLEDQNACVSSLYALREEDFSFWILGEPFLRHFYTIYDLDQRQIGFAQLA